MTAYINKLKDKTGNQQLPVTHERAVRDDNGTTAETKFQNLEGAMDKAYVASSDNGMGRITLHKNMVSGVNTLIQSMMQATNTIYVIRYDFTLGEDITVPANCVLEFDGGSIDGGKIVFNNTGIIAVKDCFGESLEIEGKILEEACPDWFIGSDTDKVEKAIDTFAVVKLSARDYIINRQIVVNHSFKLTGSSIPDFFGDYVSHTIEDYSQSRLIASGTFDSIILIQSTEDSYSHSVVVDSVSFACSNKTGNAYSKDVDGIKIFAPGGPSRPVVIRCCNFKHLNRAIYFYNENSVGTGVSSIEISSNTIVLNNYAIYGVGRLTVSRCIICNNDLEQNSYGAIYIYENETGNIIPARDYIRIENNVMEDEPSAFKIYMRGGLLSVIGNHYENITSAEIYGNVSNPIYVELKGNIVSSIASKLEYRIENAKISNNDFISDKVRYFLKGCYLADGNCIKKIDNFSEGALSFAYNKDYRYIVPENPVIVHSPSTKEIVGNFILNKLTADYESAGASMSFESGYYALCFCAKGMIPLTIVMGSSTVNLLRESLNVDKFIDNDLKHIVCYFSVDEAVTSNKKVTLRYSTNNVFPQDVDIYISDIYVYKIAAIGTSDPLNVVGINPETVDSIKSGSTSQRPTNIVSNTPVGFGYFDTDFGNNGKSIWYAGNNTWVDSTGTPV